MADWKKQSRIEEGHAVVVAIGRQSPIFIVRLQSYLNEHYSVSDNVDGSEGVTL